MTRQIRNEALQRKASTRVDVCSEPFFAPRASRRLAPDINHGS